MKKTRPPLSWRRKLLYGLLVTALVLGGAEAGLRRAFGPPPPPVRVYNALGEHSTYLVAKNGALDASFVNPNPPAPIPQRWDGPRCAVLGGSSVHAGTPNLRPDEEFAGLIALKTNIPVINLGSPGLDSFDLVQITRELAPYHWSCLVVYTGHNDFGNAFFQARYGDLASGVGARARAAFEHFQIFVQLHRLLAPVEGLPRKKMSEDGPEYPLLDETRWWATLRYLESNLRQIVYTAKKAGIPVILVVPTNSLLEKPGDGECEGENCATPVYEEAIKLRDSDPTKAAALLRRACDLDRVALRAPTAAQDATRRVALEEGATLVDADALLPREDGLNIPAQDLFSDGLHFSAEGHKAMAELIAPYVREFGMAGPKGP